MIYKVEIDIKDDKLFVRLFDKTDKEELIPEIVSDLGFVDNNKISDEDKNMFLINGIKSDLDFLLSSLGNRKSKNKA